MKPARAGRPASIYVHLPFCARLCPYCDFTVFVRREPPFRQYIDALVRELAARGDDLRGRSVGSIYLGGGTPSLTPVAELRRLFGALTPWLPTREVTLEANPLDITAESVRAWADLGVTRISLGVQSFDDDYLSALGRRHRGADARRAVDVARGSGLRVSIDLIWGGPHHEAQILAGDLRSVQELGVGHVSGYQLTVEERTVFWRRQQSADLPLPTEEAIASLASQVDERLAELGLRRYEVSSWGVAGSWSVHNSGYWRGWEYLGVGVGAHSFRIDDHRVVRSAMPRGLKSYLRDEARAEVEVLSFEDHFRERLMLGARTAHGIEFDALQAQFQGRVSGALFDEARAKCLELVGSGFLELGDGAYRPTGRGFDFADWVGQEFF